MPVLNTPYPEEEGGGTGPGGGNVSSPDIDTILVMDRAEFDALPARDGHTVYLIMG